MRFFSVLFALALFVFFTPSKSRLLAAETQLAAKSSAPKKERGDSTVCKSGGEERMLAISVKDEGCELLYTKGGESTIVATQRLGLAKCEEVRDRIAKRLESSGYACE